MKKRNLGIVLLSSVVTFGIYGIVWHVKTKGELVKRGGDIPTCWLIIVPFAGWYWLFKYYKAAEIVTKQINGTFVFALSFVASMIAIVLDLNKGDSEASSLGSLIITIVYLGIVLYLQSSYNKVERITTTPTSHNTP